VVVVYGATDRGWLVEALGDLGNLSCIVPDDVGKVDFSAANLLVIFAEGRSAIVTVDLLARARRLGFVAPVLVVGAQFGTQDVIATLDHGADDCLREVPEGVELRARAESLLRRSFSRPLEAGGGAANVAGCCLSLDRQRRSVTVDGGAVVLTPSQFSLLQYLIDRDEQWCKPEAIMHDVLGSRHYKGTSLVRFHIYQLRRALGSAGSHIRWERGNGYMFSARIHDEASPVSGLARKAKSHLPGAVDA
jgi:DNA-binding response OmpR family regulator